MISHGTSILKQLSTEKLRTVAQESQWATEMVTGNYLQNTVDSKLTVKMLKFIKPLIAHISA